MPFEGSGQRRHAAIGGRELYVIAGPARLHVSHAEEFNQVLLKFLAI